MAVSNTVEATLVARLKDELSPAARHTMGLWQAAMNTMRSAGDALGQAIVGVWQRLTAAMEAHGRNLLAHGQQAEGFWSKLGLLGAGAALLVVGAFLKMTAAAAEFAVHLAKESSEVLELKLAFESLSQTMGVNGSAMMAQLRQATEGLVSSTVLLRNANRVMSADIPLTTEQYGKLVAAVFKLSKTSGVDASQAINTLTDALIRGNARGLQAIGLNMGHVKDAISQMAAAMGESAGKVENEGRLLTFYNELLEATSRAVRRNAADYFSLADAIQKANNTWARYKEGLGEAIGRSAVLEELLKKFSAWLDKIALRQDEINNLALAVNRWIIGMLNGLNAVATVLAIFAPLWDAVWGSVKTVWNLTYATVASGLFLLQWGITSLIEMLAKIPGAARLGLDSLAESARAVTESLGRVARSSAKDIFHSFDGFGENTKNLWAMHQSLGALSSEMEKFRGIVIQGAAGTRDHGRAAEDAAEAQKKLNEQLQKLRELQRDIAGRMATPEQAALAQLAQDFAKIDENGQVGQERRDQLKLLALRAYNAKVLEIQRKRADDEFRIEKDFESAATDIAKNHLATKERIAGMEKLLAEATGQERIRIEREIQDMLDKMAKEREEKRRQEVERTLGAASAITRAIELAGAGKIDRAIGREALSQVPKLLDQIRQKIVYLQSQRTLNPEQLEELFKLYEALDRLNRLNMTPFLKMLVILKDHLGEMAKQMTNAWASFWADMVSGQENAGKKFLAAIIDMISNEIMAWALEMTARSIVHAAMLDFAGAARYAAAAAGLGALSGILKGFASSLAQTNQAGAGASFQNDVPRPNALQVQVIQVGAPRGAQNPGQVSAAAPSQPMRLEVELRTPQGWVAKEVVREVRGNNVELRAVLNNG
ncbi:MAG: hypothetical protein ACE15B_19505 [Bryobacteraceae bacterium]